MSTDGTPREQAHARMTELLDEYVDMADETAGELLDHLDTNNLVVVSATFAGKATIPEARPDPAPLADALRGLLAEVRAHGPGWRELKAELFRLAEREQCAQCRANLLVRAGEIEDADRVARTALADYDRQTRPVGGDTQGDGNA